MSSTLRYAVQTHESTFSDSLLSNLPVAPPTIELVAVVLLLAIGTEAVDVVTATDAAAGGTTLLPLLLVLLPATAATALLLLALLFDDAPLNLAQLNLSPQLPFLDLAPVEVGADVAADATAEPACLDC